MILVIFSSLQGREIFRGECTSQEEADSFIKNTIASGKVGKPDRWVADQDLQSRGEDKSKALETKETGGPDSLSMVYRFGTEFLVSKMDVTREFIAKQEAEEAMSFVAKTDFKIIRHFEQIALSVPPTMSDKEFKDLMRAREKARLKIKMR